MARKQKRFAIVIAALVLMFGFTTLFVSPKVYADHTAPCVTGETPYTDGQGNNMCKTAPQANNGTQPNAATTANPTGTTCAVEKVGWIVCPIVEQSAKAADRLFKFLANNFLQVEPELLTANPQGGPGAGTRGVWEQARNLANIMFVIAFIFIIYSQITGAGLNNYGIKRMLPRLIIAAIAVNISYYICQAMVDISNLLGFNIMRALTDSAHASGPVVFDNTQGTNTQTSDGILGSITKGALIAAGVVWLIIAVMSGTIFIVLMICLVIVVILLLRKAFIILLVVISPFAFVAYLLPNTEKLFSKWLNMFWQLLMVFPIVAMLLGGGQLASAIILNAATTNQQPVTTVDPNCNPDDPKADRNGGYKTPCEGTVDVGNGKNAGWTMGLVAAGISVAPLLAVWAVLKGALSAAGAIGGKIAGAVQKGGAGIGGAGAKGMVGARKKGQEAYKNSTVGQMRAFNKKKREGDIRAGAYTGKNPLRRARSRTNRALNEFGEGAKEGSWREDFNKQRFKTSEKDRSARAREKAEEYAGNGNYAEMFDKGQDDFNKAKTQNAREEAMVTMNAARMAASRLDDGQELARMRPLMRTAQSRNQSGRNIGGAQGQAASMNADESAGAAARAAYTNTTMPAHQASMAAYEANLAAHEAGNTAQANHQRQMADHMADVQYRANLVSLGMPAPTTPPVAHPGNAPAPGPAHPGPAPTAPAAPPPRPGTNP
jgi:hypothetical protein